MYDTAEIICPYCFEQVEVSIDPDDQGELIRDCDVCCRPWLLHVSRDGDGQLRIDALRSQ